MILKEVLVSQHPSLQSLSSDSRSSHQVCLYSRGGRHHGTNSEGCVRTVGSASRTVSKFEWNYSFRKVECLTDVVAIQMI